MKKVSTDKRVLEKGHRNDKTDQQNKTQQTKIKLIYWDH